MSEKILFISHSGSEDEVLKELVIHISLNRYEIKDREHIQKTYIDYYKSDSDIELIIIHSSKDLELKSENCDIVYFSFGCADCGDATDNGKTILKIIENIKQKEKLTKKEINKYRQELINLQKSNPAQSINIEKNSFLKSSTKTKMKEDYYLYIPDVIDGDIKGHIEETFKISSTNKDTIIKESNNKDFIYVSVLFAGFGSPQIAGEGNINNIINRYNNYFLELKELQEQCNYKIIFLFIALNDSYIPDFFKDYLARDRNIQKEVNKIFVSPIKNFNEDNHNRFLFAEMLYSVRKGKRIW
jgi:hypothetical protein